MDSFKMESLKFTKNCNCGVKKSSDYKVEANIENFVLPSQLISHIIINNASELTERNITKCNLIIDIFIQKLAPDRCIVNCVFLI
ncbi:MAG TPA: hypothetical protein VIK14_05645 [Ignavibacteria bacterium]